MSDSASAGKTALVAVTVPLLALSTIVLVLGGAGANAASSTLCGGAGTGQTVAGVSLDAEQMGNAQTIVAVTAGRTLPALAAVIAVDTAYTESTLHNSASQTDHDSEGLFQQRVSIYGAQVADDPVNATNAFLDRLIQISDWQSTPIGADAQTVQQSAHPERYQPNAGLAQQVVGQLWPTAAAATSGPDTTATAIDTSSTTGSTSKQTFFTDVLQTLNLPISPGNLDALFAVAQLEGPNDRYNPLNSVAPEPGSTPVNTAGVQRYLSFDSGVQGTVDLLRGAPWNGVRAALAADPGTAAVLAAFTEAYTWDSGVTFPTANLAAVATRSVGPVPGNAAGPAICAGGGGVATGGTVAGTIVGPTGDNVAGTTTIPAGLTLSGSAQGNAAVQYALAQLGKPYVFAAVGPNAFDCSGLTMAAWAAAGVALPHLAAGQVAYGTAEPTDLSQAVSGDLVMIPGSDGTAQAPGHVGMVAGYVDENDGRHLFLVQAPETGVPVMLTEATEWSGQIVNVRHIA